MFPEEIQALEDLGSRVLLDKGDRQLRMEVSEFRDNLYFSIRWWNKTYEEDGYFPTTEGVTIPYTLETAMVLWKALVSLLSQGEVLGELIKQGILEPETNKPAE